MACSRFDPHDRAPALSSFTRIERGDLDSLPLPRRQDHVNSFFYLDFLFYLFFSLSFLFIL